MKISVTAEHIKNGFRHNSNKCPIALALHDAPDIVGLNLSENGIAICHEDTNLKYRNEDRYTHNFTNGDRLADIIGRFDRTGFMEPFTIDMNWEEFTMEAEL